MRRITPMARGLAMAMAVVLAVLPAAPAQAATFTVTTTADDPAADCTGSTGCSLRGALAAADAAAGPDTIIVPMGDYQLSLGPLDVDGAVTIEGAGQTSTRVLGMNARVLNVWTGPVTVRDLAISGGSDAEQGGGVFVVTGASMTGERISVSGNASAKAGGGIVTYGVLELIDSTVTGNTSADSGGGIAVIPGGSATLTDTTVSDNTATVFGGGISAFGAPELSLVRSTIDANSAGERGGGLWVSSPVRIEDTAITENVGAWGGGVFAQEVPSVVIEGSTLSGNHATGGAGGAGGALAAVGPGSLSIDRSTLSDNTATGEGGAIELSAIPSAAPVSITRSTLAGNSSSSVAPGQLRIAADADSYTVLLDAVVVAGQQLCSNGNVIDSAGLNVIQAAGPCPFEGAPVEAPDLVGVDPLLGSLAANGGPTQTHALLPGSPAIDLGGDCRGTHPLDQRGLSRDARCDSGAFEVQPPPPPVDRAPIADAGGPYAATAGVPLRLDATGSRDPDGDALAIAWDLDGDGDFDDATGPTPEVVITEPGEQAIAVQVTARGRSATDTTTVVVDVPATLLSRGVPGDLDAVEVALAWSQLAFPQDTATSSDPGFSQAGPSAVLLGRADLFADSLASGGAQGVLGAPLLLTAGDALDPRVADELRRLAPDRVILLGGEAALAPAVQDDVAALGLAVERIAGPTRIETAAALADLLGPAPAVVLARAGASAADGTQAFADALAAGALAAERGVPLLLTESDRLSPAAAAAITATGAARVLVAGGTAAVGDAVVEALEASDLVVQRLSGDERAGTAVAIATARGATTAGEADGVILVDGAAADAWVDAFPAALSSARLDAPVVLAAGRDLPPATATWLDGGGVPLVCGARLTATACDAAIEVLRPAAS